MKEANVKEVETVKVTVPKFGTILTARPEGMSFSEYRHRLAMQNAKLKARRQVGFLCCNAFEPCVGKSFILNYV